jgi:SlyX protein
MTDRIEALEVKVAWLEQANTELSDLVYRQRQEIDALNARLLALADRLEAERQSPTAYTLEDEKPPHY